MRKLADIERLFTQIYISPRIQIFEFTLCCIVSCEYSVIGKNDVPARSQTAMYAGVTLAPI